KVRFAFLQSQLNRHAAQLWIQERVSVLQYLNGLGPLQFWLGRAGKFKKALDDPLQTIDFVANDRGVFVLDDFRQGFSQAEQAELDGGERISDFVGDARSERAQGCQFFLPLDIRL